MSLRVSHKQAEEKPELPLPEKEFKPKSRGEKKRFKSEMAEMHDRFNKLMESISETNKQTGKILDELAALRKSDAEVHKQVEKPAEPEPESEQKPTE
jgi:hypothetical protein